MPTTWISIMRMCVGSMTCILALCLTVAGCENPSRVRPVLTSQRSEPVAGENIKTAVELPPKAQPEPKVSELAAAPQQPLPPATAKLVKKPTATPELPPVLLSEQHRKACKVFVGDTLPAVDLPDLEGKKTSLSDHFGKKLTLVCFFEGTLPSEEQMLSDLTPEVADPFGKQDVAVVGIAVGQAPDSVAKQMKKFGVTFPVLVDTDRAAYETVATEYLPRLFLIDADGKILWLDLEYSATTRRQINDAIRHVLKTT